MDLARRLLLLRPPEAKAARRILKTLDEDRSLRSGRTINADERLALRFLAECLEGTSKDLHGIGSRLTARARQRIRALVRKLKKNLTSMDTVYPRLIEYSSNREEAVDWTIELAESFVERKDYGQALKLLRQTPKWNPQEGGLIPRAMIESQRLRARCREGMKQYKAAIDEWRPLAHKLGSKEDAWHEAQQHRILCYIEQGQNEHGRELFEIYRLDSRATTDEMTKKWGPRLKDLDAKLKKAGN
jgi:tetratricopeptide (TPR) repeat protein